MRRPRVRWTVGWLMVVIAGVALVLGGVILSLRPQAIELRPHPLPTRVNVDHAILDVVLSDLLLNEEFPHQQANEAGPSLVLGIQTEEGSLQSEGGVWSILAKNQVDPEILEDVTERNPREVRYSLAGYKPSNSAIMVRDLDADRGTDRFLSQFSEPPWATVLLPGYSQDGKVAVLRFSFGPTAHGADGVYVLKRVNGRWEVVDKELLFYL